MDADAVEVIRKAAKTADVDLVACPAVVYECLRMSDIHLRRRLAKALTRNAWLRPMPEAFVEAEELREEITRLRPEWLVARPETRNWHQNRNDWRSGFWRRVRHQTDKMARIVSAVDYGKLDRARNEAKAARSTARELGHRIEGLRLDTARSWYLRRVPGWDGEPFEAWRGHSEANWWQELILRPSQTSLDWLEPWLQLNRIRSERPQWITFWTRECAKERLPREWLRWAMGEVQSLRKVTPGTPVDNQIATYLVDYDYFVTGDRAFAECIEVIRPHAPAQIAATSVSPAGKGAVDHLLELFENVGDTNRTHPEGDARKVTGFS
ncbi:hypothetical protein RB614_03290 [Phytohabitans sp. ZYX-F-186]|uniref:Uncharacterized protein n=1 Tax=Phytohabitans maris TaxID=3071409 RepID=A0ABU0Z913_9ACTN|nr:hypothetical protein [Phytohabitans sp. ZYX-F-186]MDQ7903537.1 hypothetical protein [Phytohabitans sp. ZYX-F-186]